jgi:hypothetical protein
MRSSSPPAWSEKSPPGPPTAASCTSVPPASRPQEPRRLRPPTLPAPRCRRPPRALLHHGEGQRRVPARSWLTLRVPFIRLPRTVQSWRRRPGYAGLSVAAVDVHGSELAALDTEAWSNPNRTGPHRLTRGREHDTRRRTTRFPRAVSATPTRRGVSDSATPTAPTAPRSSPSQPTKASSGSPARLTRPAGRSMASSRIVITTPRSWPPDRDRTSVSRPITDGRAGNVAGHDRDIGHLTDAFGHQLGSP